MVITWSAREERTKKQKRNKDRKNTHVVYNDATAQKLPLHIKFHSEECLSWREPRFNVLSRSSSKRKATRSSKTFTACLVNILTLKMEIVISYESSLNFYHTTWRHSQNIVLFKKSYVHFRISSSYILQVTIYLQLVIALDSNGSFSEKWAR
jgi:hypothetical protein